LPGQSYRFRTSVSALIKRIFGTIQPATKVRHEMVCQSWNIFAALAKRRNLDWKDAEPVVKVLAETLSSGFGSQLCWLRR
jgi:hypothetical protein